jgi:endonuclease YncB( thermonuclease family)
MTTILLLLMLLTDNGRLPFEEDLVSYAIVQDDGTLVTGSGHRLELYGIYIPLIERTCRTFIVPSRCGPRSVLMLDFKINGHFVHCDRLGGPQNGITSAVCRVDGEDVAVWMLEQGWAVARPDAPFEYLVLEKIARERNRGIWGMIVE